MAFGVNVIGYLHSEKGLGEAARGLIRALQAAGIPHALNNFVDHGSANVVPLVYPDSGLPYDFNLLAINPDNLPHFCRCVDLARLRHDRYTIGYWHWELPEFPTEWSDRFACVDEVWVSSTFTQKAIALTSPVPVLVMPPALDRTPNVDALSRATLGVPDDAFVALFAFDAASTLARKNPVGAIQAFQRAFPDDDSVRFLIKTSRLDIAPDRESLLQAARGDARIQLLGGALSRAAMTKLLSLSDCYLSLHRAEGFGLTLAESMLLGKSVIATGYSGNLDYMTHFNSRLVDSKLITLETNSGPYRAGQVWAEPDIEHAAVCLQQIRNDPAAARHLGQRAKEEIADTLDPARVGAQIHRRLRTLTGRTPRPR